MPAASDMRPPGRTSRDTLRLRQLACHGCRLGWQQLGHAYHATGLQAPAELGYQVELWG